MERVTIPKEIYNALVYESILLNCLITLGLEEWEVYGTAVGMALQEYHEQK